MIGQSLKGYLIVEKIRDGSVGTVWKATSQALGAVAVKQISAGSAAVGRKLRQFRREASLLLRLDHPAIVKVHEYVDLRPQPFFAMEYFESENLKHAMWHQPERVRAREFGILRQVAEALRHLHEKGIVHKDLKPENILVSPSSEVRLIDLSMAQTRLDRLLQFGRRAEGTPLYMAPEQVVGRRCDARTDVYGFGVLMYELLTKRPPFLATTQSALLEKHLKVAPPTMRTFVPTIAPELDALCARMLAKKPEDRFGDMMTVLHELYKWEKRDTGARLRQTVTASLRDAMEGAGA